MIALHSLAYIIASTFHERTMNQTLVASLSKESGGQMATAMDLR